MIQTGPPVPPSAQSSCRLLHAGLFGRAVATMSDMGLRTGDP